MKYKSILLFVALVAIIASFNFVSCNKYESESDGYSAWTEVTEADSVIFAKARTAFLNDPANAGSADFMIMQLLSNPYAVRTMAVENGMNYQFACKDEYVVTVYKGNGDGIGKVIAVEAGVDDGYIPIPPPRKRDTIFG